MPSFSKGSQRILLTCDKRLQSLMNACIEETDFSIICGTRGKKEQDAAYAAKLTKLKYPHSKHNRLPSMAVDIAPYPIDWQDVQRFKDLAKIVLRKAKEMKIPIRWGGDFNCNGIEDDSFVDMPHYEIRG